MDCTKHHRAGPVSQPGLNKSFFSLPKGPFLLQLVSGASGELPWRIEVHLLGSLPRGRGQEQSWCRCQGAPTPHMQHSRANRPLASFPRDLPRRGHISDFALHLNH